MKKKIFKMVAATLAAVTVFGITGCNEKKEETTEVATLKWYFPGKEYRDTPEVEAKINEIIEPAIGANIDLVALDSGAYDEKLNMMMASGDEFDICFSGYVNTYHRGTTMGGFLKLDEYLEDCKDLKEAIPDYAWKAVDTGDGIYAVPNMQIYAYWQALYFMKEYTDKYNFDVSKITHINDIEPFLKNIRDNEPNLYPFDPSFRGTAPWNECSNEGRYENIVGIVPLAYDNVEKKVVKKYELDFFKEGVDKLRSWYQNGYIRKDIASADSSGGSAKESAVFMGAYKPGAEADVLQSKGYEVVAFPLGKAMVDQNMSTQTLNAVGANTKYPEKAVKFLEILNTNEEVYRLVVHGIEGKHYEVVGDNTIKLLDKDGYNNSIAGWKFGNQFMSYVIEGKPADTYLKMKELNDSALQSALLGYTVNTDSIINEAANISAIVGEFYGLDVGTLEPEQFDRYVKKLEEAGIDRVQEEIQRQIDEFLKK